MTTYVRRVLEYVGTAGIAGVLFGAAGFLAADVPRDLYTFFRNSGNVVHYETDRNQWSYIRGMSGRVIPLERSGFTLGAAAGGLIGILVTL